MSYNQWFFKYHTCYFEDPNADLATNEYLIYSTKINLFNYQVQTVLSNILQASNVPETPEPQQEIKYSQLNQEYIEELRAALGSFKNRQWIDDLETWLRVNNLLAIFSNHGTVTVPANGLLTFVQAHQPNDPPAVSANDTYLTRLVNKRNHQN